jgi:transposase
VSVACRACLARLTNAGRAVLEPLIPDNRLGGRTPTHSRRAVTDAILTVVRQGVTWPTLPAEFTH